MVPGLPRAQALPGLAQRQSVSSTRDARVEALMKLGSNLWLHVAASDPQDRSDSKSSGFPRERGQATRGHRNLSCIIIYLYMQYQGGSARNALLPKACLRLFFSPVAVGRLL